MACLVSVLFSCFFFLFVVDWLSSGWLFEWSELLNGSSVCWREGGWGMGDGEGGETRAVIWRMRTGRRSRAFVLRVASF